MCLNDHVAGGKSPAQPELDEPCQPQKTPQSKSNKRTTQGADRTVLLKMQPETIRYYLVDMIVCT